MELGGADYLHIDVMDGHFVPNLTIGPPVVRSLRSLTRLPLDVHLMITNPEDFVPAFADAGADIITVHAEAIPHLPRAIAAIRHAGASPGVAISPGTPVAAVSEVLDDVDVVLVLTVDPGFGGQTLIRRVLSKIAQARRMLDDLGCKAELEVDGGINRSTARHVVDRGASVLVAGSAVFHHEDGVARAVAGLREAALTRAPRSG